jgi:hypothetical protein
MLPYQIRPHGERNIHSHFLVGGQPDIGNRLPLKSLLFRHNLVTAGRQFDKELASVRVCCRCQGAPRVQIQQGDLSFPDGAAGRIRYAAQNVTENALRESGARNRRPRPKPGQPSVLLAGK